MFKIAAALSLVLTTCFAAYPKPVPADDDHPRSVAVTGTAVARVKPDTINWNVEVTTTDSSLTLARETNDQAVSAVLQLRDTYDIDAEDVQTGNLRIRKVFERDRSGNQGAFRHYSVQRTIVLKQRESGRFDDLLGDLTGIDNVAIRYSLASSEFHKVRRETRLRAVQIAREKAEEMTSLLGAKLGHVLTIDESSPGREHLRLPTSNTAFSSGEAAQPDDIQGTFAPGSINVRVSVDIRFAIE